MLTESCVKEVKKMKCFQRLIFKQFVQGAGLCGQKFLSYLPKRRETFHAPL